MKAIIWKIAVIFVSIAAVLFSYLLISLRPVISENELAAMRNDLKSFSEEYKRNASHARYDFVKNIYSIRNKDSSSMSKTVKEIATAWIDNSGYPADACAMLDKYADLPEKLEPVKALPEGIIPVEKWPDAGAEIEELSIILYTLRICAKFRNEYDEVFRIQQIEMVLWGEQARSMRDFNYVIRLPARVREIVGFVRQNKIEPEMAMKQLNALEKLAISPKASWELKQLEMYEMLEWMRGLADSREPFKALASDMGWGTAGNAEFLTRNFPWLGKKIFLSGMTMMFADRIVTYRHLKEFDGDVFKSGSACDKVESVRSGMNWIAYVINTWTWGLYWMDANDDSIQIEINRQRVLSNATIIAAIEMFRKKEKRLPKSLTELSSEYLKIPNEISYEVRQGLEEYRLISPAFLYDSDGELKFNISQLP